MNLGDNRKTISDDWLRLIYQQLEKANQSYMRMHEGCQDIQELLDTGLVNEIIDYIRYKNAGLLLTTLENITINARALMKNEKYDAIKLKLHTLKEWYTGGLNNDRYTTVYQRILNERTKAVRFVLNENFNVLVIYISKVYMEIIDELTPILYVEGNVRSKPRE